MDPKKLIFSWVAAFIAMFSLSGLWYLVLMADYYNEQFAAINRAEPVMIWIVLSYIITTFLMAYIYTVGYKGGTPIKEGLRFGILIGLIMALPSGLIFNAVYNVTFVPTLVDIIYQVIEKCIGGIVIGVVYGTGVGTE